MDGCCNVNITIAPFTHIIFHAKQLELRVKVIAGVGWVQEMEVSLRLNFLRGTMGGREERPDGTLPHIGLSDDP